MPRAPRRPGRRGCGASGWISPFGGNAKLPWNLEWAAQWSLFGVTIEPCGKDLSTAGGSRDRSRRHRPRGLRARAAAQRALRVPQHRRQEDVDVQGPRRRGAHHRRGRSRPSSSGSCSCARSPTTPSSSTPTGTDQIPRLFDEFDKFAAATAGREVKGELPPGYEATFRYSLLDPAADVAAEAAAFRPAFSHLALLAQIPGVDVAARVEAEKGSALTERERAILEERLAAARGWLDAYAPERAVVKVQRDALPAEAADARPATSAASWPRSPTPASDARPEAGDAWQDAIFRTAAVGAASTRRRAFDALYLRLPRPAERPACRLAAGQPGPRPSSSSGCVRPAAWG